MHVGIRKQELLFIYTEPEYFTDIQRQPAGMEQEK